MMDSLSNATQMSILTRFLANIFVFLVLLCSLVAASYELLTNQQINPIIMSILATGIGYALHMLGLNQGVTLEPVQPTAQKEPAPPTQQ